MRNNWPTNLSSTLLTPRKAAWTLVISGIVWFVYMSPKTPVEFFDAAAGDEASLREWEAKNTGVEKSAATAAKREQYELMSCHRQMQRIALVYDITHDPRHVNRCETSIVEGFYEPEEATVAVLRSENDSYRAP